MNGIPTEYGLAEVKRMIDEKKLLEKIDNNVPDLTSDQIYKIAEVIVKQPKVNEWIPCRERLPKCNGCYLVWRPHYFGGEIGMPAICYFDGQDTWHDSYGVDFTRILNKNDVIAWMPLPEPYMRKKVEE